MPTITKIGNGMHDKSSHYQRRIFQYTGPASYVAGGDALPPESVGLGTIVAVLGPVAWNGSASRILAWDPTNKKIVWYVPNTGSEATGDLSAYKANLEVIGY
jgi:hypothetical protein